MKKVKIGNYVKQIRGVSYKTNDLHNDLNSDSVILLRANNINEGKINFDDIVYVDKSKVKKEQYLKKGDILVCASSGSKELVGKAAFINKDYAVTFGAFCKLIRPKDCIAGYLGHYFNSQMYKEKISSLALGANINNIRNEHIDELLIYLPNKAEQQNITILLDEVSDLTDKRKKQLKKLDELVKSRFIEMFGDPINNSKKLPTNKLKDILVLKAGDFTSAADIVKKPTMANIYPCYGGNGIRGYVSEYNQEGEYSLIGRQGALSGNVQYAKGKFKNTEHALLVTPLIKINSIWLNQLLLNLDLKRYQTGAAQPGLSVKNLQEIQIIDVSIEEQNQFAAFVKQIDKSKFEIKQSLEKLELLKKALMQKYFG